MFSKPPPIDVVAAKSRLKVADAFQYFKVEASSLGSFFMEGHSLLKSRFKHVRG